MSSQNNRFDSGITNKDYWDGTYTNKIPRRLLNIDSYKYFCDRIIWEKIREYYTGGNVLEVGSGNSDWLVRIAKELKPGYYAGLDYSEDGCRLLEEKSKENGVNIDVVHADMFSPPVDMIKKFNFIMSFGVVEHFKDLSEVLGVISQFSKSGGVIFSLIPNMAGLNGALTRFWNKGIYDIHIAHDLPSFVNGHHAAGLDILWADYLGSSNIGVMSSCFQKHKGVNFFIYKQLTRISKMLWFFESKMKELPATKTFSPYILVVSQVPE